MPGENKKVCPQVWVFGTHNRWQVSGKSQLLTIYPLFVVGKDSSLFEEENCIIINEMDYLLISAPLLWDTVQLQTQPLVKIKANLIGSFFLQKCLLPVAYQKRCFYVLGLC